MLCNVIVVFFFFFFFSSRRRHTRCSRDWSSDVCSSDLMSQTMAPRFMALATKRASTMEPSANAAGATTNRKRVKRKRITAGCQNPASPTLPSVTLQPVERERSELLLEKALGGIDLRAVEHAEEAFPLVARLEEVGPGQLERLLVQAVEDVQVRPRLGDLRREPLLHLQPRERHRHQRALARLDGDVELRLLRRAQPQLPLELVEVGDLDGISGGARREEDDKSGEDEIGHPSARV